MAFDATSSFIAQPDKNNETTIAEHRSTNLLKSSFEITRDMD
jgi:hypothetical protein